MIPAMIIKNLKIIFRSPFTIFLLIFSPILLMFIVGFTYSGADIQGTTVGLIDSENPFEIKGVSYKKFNNQDYAISLDQCIKELKNDKLELCLFYKPTYDNSKNVISAEIIYYIDNTRPQISDRLIREYNARIDYVTEKISVKTVEEIFKEIKDTVDFMNESRELIIELEEDLGIAKEGIKEFQEIIQESKVGFDNTYFQIQNMKNELISDLDTLDKELDNIEYTLGKLDSDINYMKSGMNSNLNVIDSTIFGLETYGALNPTIYNYIDINDLEDISDSYSIYYSKLDDSEDLIGDLKSSIDNIENPSTLKNQINEIVETLDETKEYISLIEQETNTLLIDVEEKERKIKEIRKEVDSKLNYFNELANKDATQITSPISKKVEMLFNKNFYRIHQLAPTIVVLIILFIGLLLSNVIVSLEINSKAYFRNLISPVKQRKFIFALFITSFLIILFQLSFLLFILDQFFGMPVISNIGPLLIVIIHALLVFILIGVLLAYIFSSIQISILVTTFLMLFMFLLSGFIIPLELMPKTFATIISYSPVVISENLLRLILFMNEFTLTFNHLILFYPYIFILIILVSIFSKQRVKKLF